MNQVRARTTSRNPTLRLLLVGLAFILVNLYVALRDCLTTYLPGRPETGSVLVVAQPFGLLVGSGG